MTKIKMPEFPVWKKREYSEQEIISFSAELEKYRIGRTDPFDPTKKIKYLSVGGEYAYLQDKRIIEAVEKIKLDIGIISDLPVWRIVFANWKDFSEHQNKIKQYHDWKYNKERKIKFAGVKELAGWDKIAKTMPEISRSEEITTDDVDVWFEKPNQSAPTL